MFHLNSNINYWEKKSSKINLYLIQLNEKQSVILYFKIRVMEMNREKVLEVLGTIIEPDLKKDIVSLNLD